jgi:hypothetical protein
MIKFWEILWAKENNFQIIEIKKKTDVAYTEDEELLFSTIARSALS